MDEADERFRAIFESASIGIAVVGNGARFLDVNPTLSRMLGYTREELIQTSAAAVTHPADLALTARVIAGAQSRDKSEIQVEKRYLTKQGEIVWGRTTVIPLQSGPDSLALIENITERKSAEEALRNTAQQLERSNEDLRQFAAVASHDLQEPLRMVASFVGLLKARYGARLDADGKELLDFAIDGATRMNGLLKDLLSYARLDAEPLRATTDCEAAFESAIQDLRPAIEAAGAQVTRGPLPMVNASPFQITRVFQNLVGNAIKFRGERRPEIHVAADRRGDEWLFSVRDNGIGIAPGSIERLFTIFQRLHGREAYPGNGIGLAISKKAIERHGGRIWIESTPGAGSTFLFTLPARACDKSA